MERLVVETITDITYYKEGSKLIIGKLDAELVTLDPDLKGIGMVATFEYFGYDGTERFQIQSGSISKTKDEMNAMYDLIRSGVPIDGTKSDIILYENSVTLIYSAVEKFTELNPELLPTNFQIKV